MGAAGSPSAIGILLSHMEVKTEHLLGDEGSAGCREIWEPGTTVLPGGNPGARRARRGVECAVGLCPSGLLAGLQLPPSPRKRPHETLSLGLLEAGSGQNECSHGGTLGLGFPYLTLPFLVWNGGSLTL